MKFPPCFLVAACILSLLPIASQAEILHLTVYTQGGLKLVGSSPAGYCQNPGFYFRCAVEPGNPLRFEVGRSNTAWCRYAAEVAGGEIKRVSVWHESSNRMTCHMHQRDASTIEVSEAK
jgi:hypothetical protein